MYKVERRFVILNDGFPLCRIQSNKLPCGEEALISGVAVPFLVLRICDQGVDGKGEEQGDEEGGEAALDADHHLTEQPGDKVSRDSADFSHSQTLYIKLNFGPLFKAYTIWLNPNVIDTIMIL